MTMAGRATTKQALPPRQLFKPMVTRQIVTKPMVTQKPVTMRNRAAYMRERRARAKYIPGLLSSMG